MTEKIELKVGNPQKMKLKMGTFEPPLKIFLFLKVKFINFYLIPVAQMYQNESAPIFYYAKSKKYCLKLLKIAVLQPPDWIQRKKNTLYNEMNVVVILTVPCRGARRVPGGETVQLQPGGRGRHLQPPHPQVDIYSNI